MGKLILLFLGSLFIVHVAAKEDPITEPLTAEEWKSIANQVHLLEGSSALLPSLLPFIMENSDALQLTKNQVALFRDWRDNNYTNMVSIMNAIIALKLQFRAESMSPDVSKEYLKAIQSRIHELQRDLLEIRLSCRERLMTTFTEAQWDNFAFVASDHPKYANLLIKQDTAYPYASYEKWLAEKHSNIAPAGGSSGLESEP